MAAYADTFGIFTADLETRIAAGESISEIALSMGLIIREFRDLKNDVRTSVVEQAVSEGILPEEQAEWMKTRRAGVANGSSNHVLGSG